MLLVLPASEEDVQYLTPRLRREDVEEMTAMGQIPAEGLPQSFSISESCYSVFAPHEPHPFAIFGVTPSEADTELGVVWFLGTPEITKHRKAILTQAKYGWLPLWRHRFTKGLHNFVDDRNQAMLKWCRAVGFTVVQTIHIGFYTFSHIHYV